MDIDKSLWFLQKKLASVAGGCALSEAERILTFLLGCSRTDLYTAGRKKYPAVMRKLANAIVRRRLRDEPLAYILGSAYFYNREFLVTPDVLIPRTDTEVLVEEVLKNEPAGTRRFIDMGTGSGCIAAVLAAERPGWRAVASDIALPALKTAAKNCPKEIMLLCGDRLAALRGRFDFIVCNPPYIKSPALPTLEKSVRSFEPLSALDGGPDGLGFHRYLAEAAKPLLKERGRIYCEIGYDQGREVTDIFKKAGWDGVSITCDLGNRPRILRAINTY
jgi:release factor glutamine methyltransferase